MVITPGLMYNGYSQWATASIDAYLNMLKAYQEQTERMVDMGIKQMDTNYQESKNAIAKWLEMGKGYQEEFRKIIESSVAAQK